MTRPDHLFVSETDGALYDTRNADWSTSVPLRPIFCRSTQEIGTFNDLKAALRAGSTTNVGGYPLYFVAADGEPLSFEAVRDNLREVIGAFASGERRDGWRPVAVEVNYEDDNLICAHAGKPIRSAYGEPDD